MLKSSSEKPRQPGIISQLTRSKISESLKGRKDSEITRAKKSVSRKGILNPFYRIGPGIKALDIAAEKAGTKIYVYDITKFSLVNNKPFLRSSILPKGVRQKFYLFQLTHYLKNWTQVNHLKVTTITVNRRIMYQSNIKFV